MSHAHQGAFHHPAGKSLRGETFRVLSTRTPQIKKPLLRLGICWNHFLDKGLSMSLSAEAFQAGGCLMKVQRCRQMATRPSQFRAQHASYSSQEALQAQKPLAVGRQARPESRGQRRRDGRHNSRVHSHLAVLKAASENGQVTIEMVVVPPISTALAPALRPCLSTNCRKTSRSKIGVGNE